MPRPDLEAWFLRQLEMGKSVAEAETEARKQGWDDYDMWRDWAIEAAVKKFRYKHGKSDEMRRNEFLYALVMVLIAVFLMVYFSRPRF